MHRSLMTVLILTSAADAAVIQAAFNVKKGAEEFFESLVEKLDTIMDLENETNFEGSELIDVLAKLGSLVTIRGNITDTQSNLTLVFNLKAGLSSPANTLDDLLDSEDEIWAVRSGTLGPIVAVVEPYLLGALNILAQALLSSIVTYILTEASILSHH